MLFRLFVMRTVACNENCKVTETQTDTQLESQAENDRQVEEMAALVEMAKLRVLDVERKKHWLCERSRKTASSH